MGESIFDKQRAGVREDARTWALFLALRRCPALGKAFVDKLFGVNGDGVLLETWPDGFGASEPDGMLWRPGDWVALFEAKAGTNPLRSEQLRRYCRYLTSHKNRTAAKSTLLVTFTELRDAPAEVVDDLKALGVPHVHLCYAGVQHFLAVTAADADADPVARFLAQELHTWFRRAAGVETPEMITRADLSSFREHHATVDRVRAQFRERVERLVARLRGLDVPVEDADFQGAIELSVSHAGSPLSTGLTVDIAGQRVEWFVLLSRGQFAVGDEILEAVLQERLGWSRPRDVSRKGDSHWTEVEEGLDSWLDPASFDGAATAIEDRFTRERNAVSELWPTFAERSVAHAVPDAARTVAPVLGAWARSEAQRGRTLHLHPDHLTVSDRGQRFGWVEAWWDETSTGPGARLTLWAADADDIRAVGWSERKGHHGRSVAIRGVDHLKEALRSVRGDWGSGG